MHRLLGQQRRGHLAGRHAVGDQRVVPDHVGLGELPADAGLARRRRHHRHHGRHRAHGQALATYFDNHFQFYGRKLNIEFFNGQGSITNELLGSGQQQADADAVTAAQQLHAFAELNGVTEPYDVALAQQKVISFGAPYLSASFMGQYAPYMWSLDTESNDVVEATSELYLKSLAGGKAQWAGGSLQNQPRKVAIIAPSDPWYQTAAQQPCRRRRRPATRSPTTSRTS